MLHRLSLSEIDDTYERLKILGKELRIPVCEPFIHVDYINKQAKKERIISQHSQTLVRNHYNASVFLTTGISESGSYAAGNLGGKDTGSTIRATSGIFGKSTSGSGIESSEGYHGAANVDTRGILIGTSNTAESFESYVLGAKIAHGNAAGQMLYSATVFSEGWNAGSKYYWSKRERVFDNQSGGSITVIESCLVFYVAFVGFYFMTMRDMDAWGAGQAVANGESIAVNYELRVNFP